MQCAIQRLRRYECICVPGALPDTKITIDALSSPQSLISALHCYAFSCSGDSVECDGSGGYAHCKCTSYGIILSLAAQIMRRVTWIIDYRKGSSDNHSHLCPGTLSSAVTQMGVRSLLHHLISQWTKRLCSCPSPIPTDCTHHSVHILKVTVAWIDFTSLIGMVFSKKQQLLANSRWWLRIRQNDDR